MTSSPAHGAWYKELCRSLTLQPPEFAGNHPGSGNLRQSRCCNLTNFPQTSGASPAPFLSPERHLLTASTVAPAKSRVAARCRQGVSTLRLTDPPAVKRLKGKPPSGLRPRVRQDIPLAWKKPFDLAGPVDTGLVGVLARTPPGPNLQNFTRNRQQKNVRRSAPATSPTRVPVIKLAQLRGIITSTNGRTLRFLRGCHR